MATESITKEFVIEDDETLDILIKVIEEHRTRQRRSASGRYEERKRLLRECFPSVSESDSLRHQQLAFLQNRKKRPLGYSRAYDIM